jgi:hypothetical protein
MSIENPGSSPPSSPSFGLALAATSAVLLGGGTVIWAHRDSPPVVAESPVEFPRVARVLPVPDGGETPGIVTPTACHDLPDVSAASPGLHSVAYAVEHGTRVVKIRVVPGGEELVIDAATGRLIETRPGRATAPRRAGPVPVPCVPAT